MSNVTIILQSKEFLSDKDFIDFENDAVHVKNSDCHIKNCTFKNYTIQGAHKDAIQLIPAISGKSNQQYALAYLENILIEGCIIDGGDSDLQGIFASDGLFYNLAFKNNIINTKHHGITINGALKVSISNCTGKHRFYPARIGGGVNSKKLWIIGFKEEYINYESIESDSEFEDYRSKIFNNDDIFLKNFKYEAFVEAAKNIPNADGNTMAKDFYDLALKYGEIANVKNEVSKMDIVQEMSELIGVEEAVIKAIIEVESSGKTRAILFERHKFLEALQREGIDIATVLREHPNADEIISTTPYKKGRCGKNCYGTFDNQIRRLNWARQIDQSAAYQATSFGRFQIMGFNYKHAGFDDVFQFVQAMEDEDKQVRAFIQFIISQGLDEPLRRKDWVTFARGYNGKNFRGDPSTKEDDYDWKLSREYQRIIASDMPKKPVLKSKTIGSIITGGVTTAGVTTSIFGIDNTIGTVKKTVDVVKGWTEEATAIKSNISEISANVDSINIGLESMQTLIYALTGSVIVMFIILIVIGYAYAKDHGYMK